MVRNHACVDGWRELERKAWGWWVNKRVAGGWEVGVRVEGGVNRTRWRWYRGQLSFSPARRDARYNPCTRWVERTVGVCVLSAPAGFRTSNPRLGFHHGTRNAQDPPKPTGWYVRGRQIRLRTSSSSSSSACYLIPLPFSSTPVFSSCFSSSSISFSPCFSFVLSLFFVADAAERLVPLWCTYVPRCCGDVFSLPVLMLKLSRWHRATCFTTIFLFYFIFFVKWILPFHVVLATWILVFEIVLETMK